MQRYNDFTWETIRLICKVYLSIEPKDEPVQLIIDNGSPIAITDGKIAQYLSRGEHTYQLKSDFYDAEIGVVTIGDKTVEKSVKLVPNFGYFNISSNTKSEVSINNMPMGSTPYKSQKLPLGNYKVRLTAPNYADFSGDYTLSKGGETVDINGVLKSTLSTITLSTTMSDASIYVNNKLMGSGLWSGDLPEGTYDIRVTKDGHKSTSKVVNVVQGVAQTIELIAPTPIYGALNISSTPIGAEVFIDGEFIGKSPNVFQNVLIGERTVEISEDGYEAETTKITIKEGEIVNYVSKLVAQKIIMQNLPKKTFTKELYESMSSPSKCIIPDGYTEIGVNAFNGCINLTSVTIPNSVTSIEDGVFSGCYKLTKIVFNNTCFIIDNGVLLNKYKSRVISSLEALVKDNYTIPNSVSYIGDGAFKFCDRLTSVTIPNSVTNIGDYAFSYCSNLTFVTIPNSVTTVGNYAFCNCDNLTTVNIPNSVTSIGSNTFMHCDNLNSVTIPNSVTSIGNNAFLGCSKNLTVYISKSSPIYKKVKEMKGITVANN